MCECNSGEKAPKYISGKVERDYNIRKKSTDRKTEWLFTVLYANYYILRFCN